MGINATDSIKGSKAERKVQKQQEEIKKKQAELQKKAEIAKAAQELVNGLSGTEFDGRYNVKAMRKEVDKDLDEQLKAFKKDYKSGKITKEEYEAKKDLYEAAEDYLKSDWQKQKKSNVKAVVTSEVASYASTVSSTNIGEIASTVKGDIKQDYKNGDLSEEQYKAYKKGAKIGNYAGRFFGGYFGVKEKETRGMYKAQAHRNNVEKTKEEGPKFDAELQAMMNLAGITADDVYKIGDANGGAADGTINYSNKKKQEGEMDAILAEFNKNKAGIVFNKSQTNKILEQAGYTVEKKIDAGKTLTDAGRGLLIGAPFSVVHIKQHAAVDPSAVAQGVIVDATQTIDASGVIPALTTVTAATGSMIKQAKRVESRALPTNVPEGIKTYADYAKYLDSHSTKEGADIGKNLARFFKNADGTLKIEEMNKAFSTAAGTDGSTTTPLNYEEAKGLLLQLVSGKEPVQPKTVEPKKEVKAPVKEDCTVIVKQYDEIVNDTDCHKVKSGDNWDAVVRGRYSPKSEADVRTIRTQLKKAYLEEMQKQGKLQGVKVTDAFFPKVGEELCLPKNITINGNEYNFKADGQVAAGQLKKDADGNLVKNYGVSFSTDTTSNPFLKKVPKADVNACDNPIAKGVAPEEALKIANQFKEKNEDKKNITIIGL